MHKLDIHTWKYYVCIDQICQQDRLVPMQNNYLQKSKAKNRMLNFLSSIIGSIFGFLLL